MFSGMIRMPRRERQRPDVRILDYFEVKFLLFEGLHFHLGAFSAIRGF